MTRYHILATLELRHDYLEGQILRGVEWVPCEQTQQTAKNLGLILKADQGVLTILAASEEQEGKAVLTPQLQDAFSLTVGLRFNEPFWSNVTPVAAGKRQVFHFSNAQPAAEGQANLHPEEYATADDLVNVVRGSYPLADFDINALTIRWEGVDDEEYTYAIQTGEEPQLSTRMLDEGLYTLDDGSGKQTRLFVQKDAGQFDAICSLHYGGSWNETTQIIAEDYTWTPVAHSIRFPVRSTRWRYYFEKTKMEDFEGLQVVSANGGPSFESASEVTTPKGQELICFASQEPIRLRQRMNVALQLRKNVGVENRSEGVVIGRLPGPEKEVLYRTDETGNQYSDIYINF